MPRKKSYFRQAPKNNLFNEKVLHAMKKLVCTGDSHKDEKKKKNSNKPQQDPVFCLNDWKYIKKTAFVPN